MQTTFALAALVAAAYARPQAVTDSIAPSAPAPAGCSPSYSGSFEIQAVNLTQSASKAKRASSCGTAGTLTLTLAGGTLLDAQSRTGYVASNYQFQFDAPPQAGAIYTAGFSTCANGSLALGGSAVWYQCYSGGFFNIYDRNWAAQCNPIFLDVIPCSGSAPVGQSSDGQPQATTAVPPVSQASDAQPQAPTGVTVTQISDGQPQAPTGVPVTQLSDGQPQAPTGVPVTQLSDGQPQAPTGAPVSQASDGQIQATSAAAPVSQASDGQIQATSAAAPISQASDGQIQATSAVSPVTSTVATPVAQASDGQIQVTPTSASAAAANTSSGIAPFTGSASNLKASLSGLIMAAVAVAFL